jgi:hypothetical protein
MLLLPTLLLLLLQEVQRPLLAAKIEAASARKGVGLVKVRCCSSTVPQL